MAIIIDYFKNLTQKRQEKSELRQKLKHFNKRFNELDAAMERLISDHMVVESMEEYYSINSQHLGLRKRHDRESHPTAISAKHMLVS